MIPLRDTVRSRRTPLVTISIVLINIAVFVSQVRAGPRADRLLFAYGLVPARFVEWTDLGFPPLSPARFLPLVTSMFFHGGVLHLLGNLLFLWIFGDNVEDRLGRARYLAFYLLCGVAAGLTQVALAPESAVPMIGASGAIAGVLGAYLVSYPKARVLTLVPLLFIPWFIEVPAWVFLLIWFGGQVLSVVLGAGHELTGGVAFFAHIGGFLSGIVLVTLMAKRKR